MNINYNLLYRFVAKPDTWFKSGTEVIIEDGDCLWDLDNSEKHEITYQDMIERPHRIQGIFQGTKIIDSEFECLHWNRKIGDEREVGEVCGCDEFEITKRIITPTIYPVLRANGEFK